VYAVFINQVYYTQLTTVNQQAASKDVINALTYTPGSWIFALDIFGYGIMAVSTFFIGLTILPKNRADKWLKNMLMLHGLFAIGIIFPMFNLFNGTAGVDSVNNMGVIVLESWCLFFIPLMMLAANFFKETSDTLQRMDRGE
jgi:glycerol-3-phosphate acyltransferase PlsY